MQNIIFESNVQLPSTQVVTSLVAIDPEWGHEGEFGTLRYTASRNEEEIVIAYIFGTEPSEVTIQIASLSMITTACLLTCGLPIAGVVLDCYRKNKGNWKGFKECMEGQGNAVGASTIACILACQK